MRNLLRTGLAPIVATILAIIAMLWVASTVSAQTAGVTYTVNSASGVITPGATAQTVANITLNYNQSGGIYVYDIPFSLTASGGANVSNLSNCQAYNASNSVLLGSAVLAAGNNTFPISNGVRVQGGTPTTVSIRCNIATGTPSGGSFQFTSTGSTTTPTPGTAVITAVSPSTSLTAGGTGQTVANITLTNNQSGTVASVTQIPLNVTTSGGASLGQLSSCQVYNQSGTAISSGANVLNSVQNANTVTLNNALQVSGNTTENLTLRCNVASGFPSGGTYQFSSTGNPPTTTPAASLSVSTPGTSISPIIQPGAQDALLAIVSLSAAGSGNDITISSLPLTVTTGAGVFANDLTDCRVRNLSGGNAVLNTGANVPGVITTGSNAFRLDSALTIARGSTTNLAVTCDVSATATRSGTIQLGIVPSSLSATAVGTGAGVVPTGSGNGSMILIAPATTPTTPGVPNTGAGGSAGRNVLALTLSGLVTLAAGLYLRRKLAN